MPAHAIPRCSLTLGAHGGSLGPCPLLSTTQNPHQILDCPARFCSETFSQGSKHCFDPPALPLTRERQAAPASSSNRARIRANTRPLCLGQAS
eukprot:130509-Rhodomonas_salina.2